MLREKIAKIWAKWCRICRATPEHDSLYRWLMGMKWPEVQTESDSLYSKKARKLMKKHRKLMAQQRMALENRPIDLNRRFRNAVLMGLSMGRLFR